MEQKRNYKKEFENWRRNPYFDEAVRTELMGLTDETEIEDRFYRDLEFGTGGLRGIMGAGTNRLNRYTVRKVTQGLANYMNRQGKKEASAAIAYDSRHNSREFAKEAALCLCANGITVYLFDDLRPTPELSFAVRKLDCMAGIVITASHNPPEYNGYKVYWEDGAQITSPRDKEIIKEVNGVTDYEDVKTIDEEKAVCGGLFHMIGKEVDDAYIHVLKELVQNEEALKENAPKMKIVYTPLHGTGNVPVRRILKELGFGHVYVVKEQEKPDGDFPTVASPNPENAPAFAMALKLAEKTDADIVLATDPDADRLGIYAKDGKNGEYRAFTGNMSGLLICEYLLSERQKKGTIPKNGAIVTTIVSSKMAAEIAKEYKTAVIETLTGFKYIGEQIKWFEETHSHEFLFGFEESYGCLIGTNSRDKDAVVAVMMLCEAAAFYRGRGMTLCDQMERLYLKYGYFKETLHTIVKKGIDGGNGIRRIMASLRENPPEAIGGKRVLEFRDYQAETVKDLMKGEVKPSGLPKSDVLYFALEDRGWACVRPSGTEPKVKIYLGAGEDSLKGSEKLLESMWEELSERLS